MMEKRMYFFVVVLLILVSLASVIFLGYFNKSETAPLNSAENLETCKTISVSDSQAVNLVFFSSEKDAKKYSEYLSEVKPFDEFKSFNFYAITDYEPECELYEGIAILCYSKEMIKKAGSCPNDYIVVLEEEPSNIRSSSYMNIMSINLEHPLSVLPHEFGHAFANFADEYVPAKIPRGSKNCVSKCEKFEEEKDGCYEGCSKEDYFRSIENGVMRTLSSERYGVFDENLIRELLNKNSQITGNVIQEEKDCLDEKYILIEAVYNNGEIEVIEEIIQAGCAGTNGNGDASYAIYNSENVLLAEANFNPEFIFTDSLEGGEVFTSSNHFFLRVPMINEAKKLNIEIEGKTAEVNLENIGNQPCKV